MAKKYKEIRRVLIANGWKVVPQAGSHEVWAHSDHEDRIVVAGKDSDTVPVGTLGSIRRASGLEDLRERGKPLPAPHHATGTVAA